MRASLLFALLALSAGCLLAAAQDDSAFLELGLELEEDPTPSSISPTFNADVAQINAVANNVTADMKDPNNVVGYHSDLHSQLAAFSADAAKRAAESAKDFITVHKLATAAALRAANDAQGPTTNGTTGAAVNTTKALTGDALKAAVKADPAVVAAKAALAADPKNPALKAALKAARKSARLAASTPVPLGKDGKPDYSKLSPKRAAAVAARKAAKAAATRAAVASDPNVIAAQLALKKNPKDRALREALRAAKRAARRALKKPTKRKAPKGKGVNRKLARKARGAIDRAERQIWQLRQKLKKDPFNKQLLAAMKMAKKARARARAKMLKAFKRPKRAKRKPFKKGKYLSGAKRAACAKAPAKWYLKKYADLRKAFGKNNKKAAFRHWCVHGKKEGRKACFIKSCDQFNHLSKHCTKNPAKWYLDFYPDLEAAFGSDEKAAEKHYRKHGKKEKRLNCFRPVKPKIKKNKAPKSKTPKKRAKATAEPLVEKELTDCQMDPTGFYLDNNEDIKNWAGPFLRIIGRYHWCLWGRREGRQNCFDIKSDCTEWQVKEQKRFNNVVVPATRNACAQDPLKWYGEQNPDLLRAFGGSREWYSAHFCRWGRHERRAHCFNKANIPDMCRRWDPKQPRCARHPLRWYNQEWPHLKAAFGPSPLGLERTKEWYCHWGRHWGQDNCFKDPHKLCHRHYDAHSHHCKNNPNKWYLRAFWDLRQAFGKHNYRAAEEHFCKYGFTEGRPHCKRHDHKKFCAKWLPDGPLCRKDPVQWYIDAYPDVKHAYGKKRRAVKKYWCQYGQFHWWRGNCFKKKRTCHEWDPHTPECAAHPGKWYLSMYDDLRAAFGTNYRAARRHYLKFGKREGRANCFKGKVHPLDK